MKLWRYTLIGVALAVAVMAITAPVVVLIHGWDDTTAAVPTALALFVWLGACAGAVVWVFVEKVFR